MSTRTILLQITVDEKQLAGAETNYANDFEAQLRSALSKLSESGIQLKELDIDPLQAFCDKESMFRLTEFHNLTEGQAHLVADDVSSVIKDSIDQCTDLYDLMDYNIANYLESVEPRDLIERAFKSYEVILEDADGNYSFGEQGSDLAACIRDAEAHYESGNYVHVNIDGCYYTTDSNGNISNEENIPLWYDGEWEDENKIIETLAKILK